MIGGLLATLAGSAWARTAARYGVTALAILLFLLALRSSGERVGRLAEQLDIMESTQACNDGCSRRRRVALAIATSLLSGCATVGFETGALGTCPPVVEYSRQVQLQAAEELVLLPEGAAIAKMLADYVVMRVRVRACGIS